MTITLNRALKKNIPSFCLFDHSIKVTAVTLEMTLNAIHIDHFAGNECDWFILPSLRNAARGFTPQCPSQLSDLRDRKSIDAINITLSTFFSPEPSSPQR